MRRLLSPRQNETLNPLVKIAIPVMLTNMVETFYNLTDTWFLGRLGPAELAAPSIAFNLLMLIILLGNGLSSAGTTLIARAVGQNNRERVDFYLGQMTLFLLAASVLMGGFGYLIAEKFLQLINTPGEMIGMTRNYIKIISMGVPFMYGYFILQAAMQGTGNTMVALRIQLTATVINIPLDALLIFGAGPVPGWGVEGAAVATVISRAAACTGGMVILIRGKRGMKLRRRNLVPEREATRLFLRLGLPSALSHAGSTLGFTVMHGIVNTFGTAVIAAFGVVNRVHSIFYMPIHGLAKGVTTLVGQSLGAKDEEKAGQAISTGVLLAFLLITPGMILTYFSGGGFIRFFVDTEEVIREGTHLFRIISPSVILFAIFMVYVGAFQGAGDTRSIMVMHLGRLWALRVPVAWLLAVHLGRGVSGVWYAMFLSNLLITLIGYLRYKSGNWIHALDDVKD